MADLLFTKDHEWVQKQGDGTVLIGITDYARDSLGDLVYLELPKPGKNVAKGNHFAVIESVKAASEIYTPVSGEIVDVNANIADSLDDLGSDPGKGWIVKLKPASEQYLDGLMDQAAYDKYVSGL